MAEVEIVEYRESWPSDYLRIEHEISAVLPAGRCAIEHIGSTAVPGLCAKPVLDVALGVNVLAEAEAKVTALASIGFVYRPEHEQQIPDRRYFVRAAGATPRVHLHALLRDGTLWQQHLKFRNALRQNQEIRDAYAALKRHLAFVHASDKAAYTEAKAPFVLKVLVEHCQVRTESSLELMGNARMG